MRLYSNHDRKAAITEPLLLFSLKPGFPAGLSLFPRPSIAASHFTKTRVEIAVLDNSPCQIAVLGPENGDLTRGIADFGYFNPYCGAPAHASRQGIAIGAVCLARPPRTSASEPPPPPDLPKDYCLFTTSPIHQEHRIPPSQETENPALSTPENHDNARPTAQAGSPAEAGPAHQSRSGKLTSPI